MDWRSKLESAEGEQQWLSVMLEAVFAGGGWISAAPNGDGVVRRFRHPGTGADVGRLQVFSGPNQERAVAWEVEVEPVEGGPPGSRIHTFSVFTAPDSLCPHLVLEFLHNGPVQCQVVDLLPRVDLRRAPDYRSACYDPLLPSVQQVSRAPGVQQAFVSPLERVFFSPWLSCLQVQDEGKRAALQVLADYLAHWLKMWRGEISIPGGEATTGARVEDGWLRRNVYSPEYMPTWKYLHLLIGEEASAQVRGLLSGAALEFAPGAE